MAHQKTPRKTFDPSELDPIIARRVLVALLEQQPELRSTVAILANEAIDTPRMEDLAAKIEAALNQISAGDIYMGSGRTLRGYREPDEAAGELFSEVLLPHFDRVEKLFAKKDDQNARVACEAIILALYRFKHGDQFPEFEEYAEDFPEETADWAARLWRAAGDVRAAGVRQFQPDKTIPPEFVQQYVPEWDWLLSED
ncbi:MAG TPA: hypothetical protein V6C72_05945 [Chroococcales cyanobacterium]